MNKLFHSIETFKKTQGEQKTNIQYHYPPNFSESLNHPFLRLFPGFLKPLFLTLLGGLFLLTACSDDSDGNNSAGSLPDMSPVIDSIAPNPVSVPAGESIEVTVSASDPDGTIPTITLEGNTPAFVALTDNRDGSASIDIRPLETEPPARHTLVIQASSEGKTVRENLILNIAAPLTRILPVSAESLRGRTWTTTIGLVDIEFDIAEEEDADDQGSITIIVSVGCG